MFSLISTWRNCWVNNRYAGYLRRHRAHYDVTVIKWLKRKHEFKGKLYQYPKCSHYDDVIMGTIASQITSLTSVYSTVCSGADQSKHQSSASLAFVWGIHRGPVNSPNKWPVTRKMFPFDDVIMRRRLFSPPWVFTHGGVMTWTRLAHCWPFVRRNHRPPRGSRHKVSAMSIFDIFFLLAINTCSFFMSKEYSRRRNISKQNY